MSVRREPTQPAYRSKCHVRGNGATDDGGGPAAGQATGDGVGGWLATLAIPTWLVWVTVIGYARYMTCLERLFGADISGRGAPTPEACDQVPVAWSSP